jgi:uncharacterized protein YpmB
MKDRGMKKWAPFASLIEQKKSLHTMHQQRKKIAQPILSEDQAQAINDTLLVAKQKLCHLQYYDDGVIYALNTTIKVIDLVYKTIRFEDTTIPIQAILAIRLI